MSEHGLEPPFGWTWRNKSSAASYARTARDGARLGFDDHRGKTILPGQAGGVRLTKIAVTRSERR